MIEVRLLEDDYVKSGSKKGETFMVSEAEAELLTAAGVAEPAVTITLAPNPTGLPADYPARGELVAAGYETVESVGTLTDEQLGEINGIGAATIKKIREYKSE